MRKTRLDLITLLVLGIAGVLGVSTLMSPSAGAASEAQPAALPPAAETCLSCHDEPAVTPILGTPHAVAADPHSGFAEHGCATCHGPSLAHMQRPERGSRRAPPDKVFGAASTTPAEAQNATCLDCHRSGAGMHWQGSTHDHEGLACATCHRAHTGTDPMQDATAQSQTCYGCHRSVRTESLRPSHHPLHDERMACSDCHAVHGSSGPSLLTRGTVNETCYQCHADLRGPFLWEHPPVREDCLLCHRPHGSVQASLLRQRGPWLCQQCHMAQFHPSAALSGTGLPGEALPSGSSSMLGRNCMNCHSQVHGSNHPSGAGFTR
ncbi:DmsE family decaheme c-type cytochrome [Marilutibacter alkalisoli]|uniref:DmsE family decaheme c-type cytochrome n=1 Tax=Marilutibacter alkalisoli TaxID=2591633 RepID=A0A514BRV1_9GAMM|nr:DmsE family decaheme c-type cytochrome [Lysobacter alkalisoli]QDH70045.1 DmsE family decaheme c-type cytochrome [Lysobacter alkalisoli]